MFRQYVFCGISLVILVGLLSAACTTAQPSPQVAHQYDQAREAARTDAGPVNVAAQRLYEAGQRSYQAGAWAEAADLFAQAADVGVIHFPQRADALIFECLSLMHGKKYQDAYKVATQAVQDYPERWELRVILVEYLLYRERPDLARDQLQTALRLAPYQPGVLRAAAKMALTDNDLAAAEQYARQAFSQAPEDPSYRKLLADVDLQRAKALLEHEDYDPDEVLGLLFGAATHDPKNPEPPFLLGRVAIALGEVEPARRWAARGRALLSEQTQAPHEALVVAYGVARGTPGSHRHNAEEYLRQGKPALAAQELEQELLLVPENTGVWRQLGLLALDLDDEQRATECLYSLWVLEGNGNEAVELEQALQLTLSEAPASPGFVERAEIGAGWNADANQVTGAAAEFPANQRVYLTLVLANAVGRRQVRLVLTDPRGHRVIDETLEMEFFGVEFALVRSGAWSAPGDWKVEWTMDGAPRANTGFRLR